MRNLLTITVTLFFTFPILASDSDALAALALAKAKRTRVIKVTPDLCPEGICEGGCDCKDCPKECKPFNTPLPTPLLPVKPSKPEGKLEYRMIEGKIYQVPVDSPWVVPSSPPMNWGQTQGSGGGCSGGNCPLPRR